jgi:ERCC4-type nuclease
MKIIIDERETMLYSACVNLIENNSLSVTVSKKVLPLGDILIVNEEVADINNETAGISNETAGINNETTDISNEQKPMLTIERKSLSDLLASIKDGRYEEQSYRLMGCVDPKTVIYIIEGMFSQLKSYKDKKLILSAMTSLNIFKGFNVIRTCSIQETAELLVFMGDKMHRDIKKGKIPYYKSNSTTRESTTRETENIPEIKETENKPYCTVVKKVKKDNLTPENIGEVILCQIPGISSVTAIALMQFADRSLSKLMGILETSPETLDNIQIGNNAEKKTRKISKKNIENLRIFLLGKS